MVLVVLLLGIFLPIQAYSQGEGGPIYVPGQTACIGGATFSLAEPIPSSRCLQGGGILYYYFTYSDKTYYASVEKISGYRYDDNYSLYLKKNNVILDANNKYQLTIYDENRNQIGSSKSDYGTLAAVEIFVSNTPNTTTTGDQSAPIITATQKNLCQ